MNILFVLTSHGKLGDTGNPTGLWYEELAAPYYILKEAGHTVTLASVARGEAPVDPISRSEQFQTEYTRRFDGDNAAKGELAHTKVLADVAHDTFDAVFYPGGHGPIFDLPGNADSIGIIERTYAAGKPLALVCHGSAALRSAKGPDGKPIVAGKRVTGFTNNEEAVIGATKAVPFLLEDALTGAGGRFEQVDAWQPLAIRDGQLITGQNPASAEGAAKLLVQALAERTH